MLPIRPGRFTGFFMLITLSTSLLCAQNPLTDIRFDWIDINNSANDYTATSSPSSGQTIDDNVSYDLFFSRNTTTDNNRKVSGYTLGGVDYDFLLDPDTLALRRLGSASRLSLWIEADGNVNNTDDEIYLAPERQVPERSLYRANLLNIGYDNVLLNSGTNASNIERIDAIFRTGMTTSTPANAAIPVMDRGANGEFKIAMIKSLDANGDPASYGNLITVNTSDFGSGVVDLGLSILFLQQALGEDPIPTGSSTQALGGTGITFAELGIVANEVVFGYSLFGVDVNTTDHTLTDISTFPTDSNNSGLDMAAGAVSAVSSDGNLVKTTGPGGYKAALNTWLKANEGITTATDASTVTDWQDQSLGNHDATTLGTAPTYRDGSASAAEAINFNPTVDFIDAAERGLQIANNSDFNVGGAPYTTKSFNIALRTGNNVTTKQQLYEQGDDDRGIDMYIESGNLVVTAYNRIDDSGSGVSSPWNTGTLSTISTALSTETEYIVTFELNGSGSGTGTVTAYLNGQSFGNFSSVGQLADHSDQIGLGDFNSQVVTPADCPVTSVVSSTGVVNPNNIIGAVDVAYAEVNTNGNIITVDFGVEYPAGTQYSITWIRRPASTGTAQMVLRESTSSGSGFVDHPSAPTVSVATPQTDVITANTAFRYLQITKTDPPSSVDFHIDAIVVDCSASVLDAGDAASFYGSIPEFIYCSEPGSFSTAQRNRIESYLAIKYGITLDQSTPVNYVNSNGDIIFNTTNNASIGGYLEYNNDIAGISRDDDAELDQPSSKSENTDAIVTIDRGATISVDDSWLVWGNDNGALTESSVATKPDTIDSRLNRVWRVAERNEVLTTSVSFDITGLGLSGNEADFSLLVAGNSSNADFSDATVLTGGTLAGNVITFTGVDLENGQYFTLGTDYVVCSPGGVEADLTLWLRADEGVTLSGSDITDWADQSGNGNDAIGAVAARPEISDGTMNYNDAFDFISANGDVLTGNGGFNTVEYWMVILPDNTFTSASTTEQVPLSGDRNVADAVDFTGSGTDLAGVTLGSFTAAFGDEILTHAMGGSTTWRSAFTGGGSITASDTYIFNVKNNSAANSTNIYQNGVTINNGTAGSLVNSTDIAYAVGAYASRLDLAIGDRDHFDGRVAEIISYSTRRTDEQRRQIQSYLAIKYGVTIDQSAVSADDRHYYAGDGGIVWNATDNATYNADIAGIGRDDISCFEQKQSKSINSGSIVAMGLNTIETDNAANGNSFASDDSFLLWGNDNASATQANASTNASLLPGNITERMTRVWKADETGTVGATTVEFDLTGLGYSTNLSDFQLIISDTNVGGDFSGGTTVPAASLVGNILTFTNVDLADGDFFTLGTARTTCGPGGISSGLQFWVRADVGVTGTTDVSAWADQSGNGNDFSQGNASNQPSLTTVSANFNPALAYNGSSDYLFNSSENYDAITSMTHFTVMSAPTNQSGFRTFYSDGNVSLIREDNSNLWGYWNGSFNSSGDDMTGDGPTLLTMGGNSTDPGVMSKNGEFLANGSGDIFWNTSPTNSGIGASNSGTSQHIEGDFMEMIMFDSELSDENKQKIESYLSIKYGITLSADTDGDASLGDPIGSNTEGDYVNALDVVVWDYSANALYHNDVAGIGRDDDGCFVQKQSASVNSDDILTVGLGTIAASNAENINVFDENGDYLVWGNDDGATADASVNTADVPTTIAERMERVWKVQDTGTVGETELQFDLTGLGYDLSDPNAFSLLIGNTSTIADAAITTGATINGNILSFSGVNLTDGQFFTIGTKNVTCGPGGVNTDIALWLRADIGTNTTTDNANITTWTDQSSPANSATEQNAGGGSPVEPTYQANEINFNPAIRFSDAQSTNNSWLETGSNTTDNAMTLISVFKTATALGSATNFTDSPALISGEAANNDDYALGIAEGRIHINAADNTTYNARSPLTYNDDIPRIATGTRAQATTAGSIQLYVNSENVASGVSTNTNLDSPGSFAIGNHSDYDANGQFEGDISEVLVFNKVLTAVERARVETYLSIKYGITRTVTGLTEADEDYLAGDGGIIWDIDGQGAYHNDIFGIGRDDLSCFEQLKSKSINSDAMVTFELDTTAFKDNDTFILSGNDNAAIEAIDNSEKPAGINSRLNREWRVQETGDVDTVLVTFDLASITGTPVGDNNLNLVRLLVDDDGNFSSGATLIEPTSIDGKTVTFKVDFTTGQYYTLGSIETNALPITLISFAVDHHKVDQVKLDWVTASETNNAFYTVERSTDGTNFEIVGNVEGAGNSDALLFYSYIDVTPSHGLSFYRLKQTDFNGQFEYSEIRSVFLEKQLNVSYMAYPNPVIVGQTLKIKYNVDRAQTLRLKVFDPRGRQLLSEEREVFDSQGEIELLTSKFQKGLNLIRVMDESNGLVTLKVFVR